jgi:hypothetical protein
VLLGYEEAALFWFAKGLGQIYMIFQRYALNAHIDLIPECERDMPENVNFIKPFVGRLCNWYERWGLLDSEIANIQYDSKRIWNKIIESNSIILYGFGKIGRKFYPWLSHFNCNIVEIWDINATCECIDNIPIVKAHTMISSNSLILICIQDKYISALVEMELRELSYSNFIKYQSLNSAIKYAIHKEYLPFLMWDHGI